MNEKRIRIGTRGSALAQAQTRQVAYALRSLDAGFDISLHIVQTAGDRDQSRPLSEVSGQGFFTGEIERALRSREIDLAVHSLKDLPVGPAEGLTIAAIPRARTHATLS